MKRGLIFFLAAFLFCGTGIWAEKLRIDYLEGMIEIKEDSFWTELYTDDTVDADSIIRLSPESLVEFVGNDTRISLIQAGVYELSDIVKEARDTDSYGLDTLVSLKIKAITDESTEQNQESSFGVRASEVEEYIADDDIQLLFSLGMEKLKEEQYDDAIRLFYNTIDYAEIMDPDDDSIGMCHYYLSYCYAEKGKETKALSLLLKIDVNPGAPYYTDYVLLYGKLLMKGFAFNAALDLFKEYIKEGKDNTPPVLQDVYFLISICYIKTDNRVGAEEYLKKTIALNPGSELGIKAHNTIEELRKSG